MNRKTVNARDAEARRGRQIMDLTRLGRRDVYVKHADTDIRWFQNILKN